MPAVPFSQIPDDARVWVFGAARPLSDDEQRRLADHVDAFIAQWAAHGSPVVGGRDLRHGQFLLVAADERATGVSGCSIDTLFRTLGDLERELGVPLRDGGIVFFRDEHGAVQAEPRPAFRKRALSGGVGPDTVVFDNTVTQVGDVRAGRWETPLARAWHARAFPVGQPAGAPQA
ncbi:MAG TPA: hypothetical protein VF665_12225 [Longimicrobium sp.]|jgi:hypothetical protein|uniref:hypothetical protein n=1 Tax=Longimicrobium sp. TaxID=2029185 RepID=UPI002EDB6D19